MARGETGLVSVMERLKTRAKRLRFGPPVAYVYNPLEYAWPVACAYFERYGAAPKDVLFLGMNPGPFGMGQTGVPFGEIAAVRDWMKLSGTISSPRRTHPKRPIVGFDCPRSEISGQRLWGAFAKRNPNADDFFARAFVLNYCPLLFLADSGANLTPDKVAKEERHKLEALCDKALAETIDALKPKTIVGVGQYSWKRASLVVGEDVVLMPHPSPQNPRANKSWAKDAKRALESAGLEGFL